MKLIDGIRAKTGILKSRPGSEDPDSSSMPDTSVSSVRSMKNEYEHSNLAGSISALAKAGRGNGDDSGRGGRNRFDHREEIEAEIASNKQGTIQELLRERMAPEQYAQLVGQAG